MREGWSFRGKKWLQCQTITVWWVAISDYFVLRIKNTCQRFLIKNSALGGGGSWKRTVSQEWLISQRGYTRKHYNYSPLLFENLIRPHHHKVHPDSSHSFPPWCHRADNCVVFSTNFSLKWKKENLISEVFWKKNCLKSVMRLSTFTM